MSILFCLFCNLFIIGWWSTPIYGSQSGDDGDQYGDVAAENVSNLVPSTFSYQRSSKENSSRLPLANTFRGWAELESALLPQRDCRLHVVHSSSHSQRLPLRQLQNEGEHNWTTSRKWMTHSTTVYTNTAPRRAVPLGSSNPNLTGKTTATSLGSQSPRSRLRGPLTSSAQVPVPDTHTTVGRSTEPAHCRFFVVVAHDSVEPDPTWTTLNGSLPDEPLDHGPPDRPTRTVVSSYQDDVELSNSEFGKEHIAMDGANHTEARPFFDGRQLSNSCTAMSKSSKGHDHRQNRSLRFISPPRSSLPRNLFDSPDFSQSLHPPIPPIIRTMRLTDGQLSDIEKQLTVMLLRGEPSPPRPPRRGRANAKAPQTPQSGSIPFLESELLQALQWISFARQQMSPQARPRLPYSSLSAVETPLRQAWAVGEGEQRARLLGGPQLKGAAQTETEGAVPQLLLRALMESSKSLSSFDWVDILGVTVIAVVCAMAVTVGVGGGGLFVPIMILIMGFSAHEATGLSQSLMMGGSIAGICLNMLDRHPMADRPLIDVKMVLLLGPAQIVGATGGVIFNQMMPAWLITFLLIITLTASSAVSLRMGVQAVRHERKSRETANSSSGFVRRSSTISTFLYSVELYSSSSSCRAGGAGQTSITEDSVEDARDLVRTEARNVEGHDRRDSRVAGVSGETGARGGSESETEEGTPRCDSTTSKSQCAMKVKASRQYYLDKEKRFDFKVWLILMATWLFNLTVTILKGGPDTFQIIRYCGPSYWLSTCAISSVLLAVSAATAIYLARYTQCKTEALFPFVKGDLLYTRVSAISLSMQALAAGILAGMVGIGGGMVLGPLMMYRGVLPRVTMAVNGTLIFITSSSAAATFLASGSVPLDIALVLAAVCCFSAFVGKFLLDHLVKRFDLGSILIFLLLSIIMASLVAMSFSGILEIVNNGFAGFTSPC